MEKGLKIFVILVIIMLAISLFATYRASKVSIKTGGINSPYVEVSDTIVEGGKLVVEVKVVNQGFSINVTGGYVEILNTGQKENISPTNSLSFNVTFPITSNLANLKEVTVQGVVMGRMNGNPIYITFYVPVSIKIVNIIRVVNFTYFNSTLNLYLEVDNAVNITLLYIQNLGVINANLSEIVVGVPYVPLNVSLAPGVHYLNFSFKLNEIKGSEIYYSSIQERYYYYVTGYLYSTIYFIPPQNNTYLLYYIRQG